jgi:hypothetical protein
MKRSFTLLLGRQGFAGQDAVERQVDVVVAAPDLALVQEAGRRQRFEVLGGGQARYLQIVLDELDQENRLLIRSGVMCIENGTFLYTICATCKGVRPRPTMADFHWH